MSSEFQEVIFDEFVELASEKVSVESLTLETYISTENMIPNKGGIDVASSLPSSKTVNKFVNGDTLFSNIRTYFEKVHFADFEGGASPDVLIFRSKNTQKLLPGYLYYIASNKEFIDFTVRTSKGAKMPRGDKGAIQGYKLLLPPLSTQHKISDILRTLDKKITLNRQINQTLEEMAQAMFKSWFVDFEPVKAKIAVLENGGTEADATLAAMQVISGKTAQQLDAMQTQHPDQYQQLHHTASLFPNAMQDSELGEIPEGWEVRHLPSVMDFLEGPGIRNWQYTSEEDGIRFINIRCIKNGDLKLESANKITKEEAFGKYAHFQLQEDDIVVSTSGTLGRYAFIREEHLPLSLNTSVIRFRPIENVSTLHFIAGYIDTELQVQLEIRASGSAQRNFGPMHLKQISMLLPHIDLLKAHKTIIEPVFRLRQSNLKEIDVLAKIRDTLLPKLLSGELQISTEDAT